VVDFPPLVVIALTYLGLVATSNAAASYANFSSIFLLNLCCFSTIDEKFSSLP
jgi:hypothetical protein